MSSALFGLLSTFDHKNQSWESYKSRIAQWFIANDIDKNTDLAGVKRRAILLSTLSDRTYKLAAALALPKQLQEIPYDDILTLLDLHFTPKRCGFADRYEFYAAVQLPEESYTQWAARLRGLTAHCEFSNVEETIRDRFVMGMRPGAEKDKLFAQDLKELTLVKAVKIAETMWNARAGAAAANPTTPPMPSTGLLYRIEEQTQSQLEPPSKSSNGKSQCQVCGFHNHKTSECRYAKFKCNNCNMVGHLRKMCKINCTNSSVADKSDDEDGKCSIRSVSR
uniref:CCHC-type domain-containing protein n=1 Tax=Heliothis virescens TaxID=7102 RepID=A0A2A4JWI9_HELVI